MADDYEEHPLQPSSPFDEIVDDEESRDAAIEWSRQQLHAGRTVEEIAAELATQGWDEDEALGLVEEVRKLSRGERGVLTRETVTAIADREYRRGSGGWIIAFPTLAAVRRLIYAIGIFRWLARKGGKR